MLDTGCWIPDKKIMMKYHSEKKRIVQKPVKQVRGKTFPDLVGVAIIILLGIIIYSNSFTCSFHFDDLLRITGNAAIRDLSNVKAWWNYYPSRPVSTLSFALNYHFNRLDVWYWHLVNLMIHLVNACLVGWLTLLIFSSPAIKDKTFAGNKKIIAFITALLFVSHPLATQSVTYIVQREASLVAMFYFLSTALYIKARVFLKSNVIKTLLFAGSLISAVMAMLTKENAFTLPFAILLCELFFLQTRQLSGLIKDYRLFILMAAFLGLIIIIPLNYSFSIFKPIPPSYMNPYTITPGNYLLTQFSVIVKYIQLLFLPVNQNLDYSFPVANTFFGIRTMLSFFVLLVLLVFSIFIYRRNRIISFGIFWFFLTLSVESGFIPIKDVIFEHRTYLPSFGFFLVISTVICLLLWDKYRSIAVFIFIVMIVSNSYLTYERNKVWKNDLTLWTDVVAKSPDKARPVYNRGIAYEAAGRVEKAMDDYTRAIEIYPADMDAYINRGVIYGDLGQWEQAIADYTKAISINPGFAKSWSNRGIANANLKQWDTAIRDYTKAIELDPGYATAWYNRGAAYGNLAQWDKSIADYTRAIELSPDYGYAYNNRGIAYVNLRQWDKAIADFTKSIGIDPKYAAVYCNRGSVYYNLGQWDKAIADYSLAIEADPKYKEAWYNRGVSYGNLGQWEKAIADYDKTLEIDPAYKVASLNRDLARSKLRGGTKR
jgi:protein O-mannosyl-transferase